MLVISLTSFLSRLAYFGQTEVYERFWWFLTRSVLFQSLLLMNC